MKRSAFIILGAVAIVAALAAWKIGFKPHTAVLDDTSIIAAGERLLPAFEQQANDINKVDIIGAGNTVFVTLTRDNNSWGVLQRDGYRANWDEVRNLLRELGQASIIAPKTARESMHARLGLADVSEDNTGGGLLRWGDAPDQALIIGIEAADLTGRYVRQPDSAQTYLVDQILHVRTEPLDWLDKSILDWDASRLSEITVRHTDGDLIRIERSGADSLEMRLANLPENRELSGQWAINSIANSLVTLEADDVRKATGNVPEQATRALFVTDNGINLVVSLYQEQAVDVDVDGGVVDEPVYLARFDVSLEPGSSSGTSESAMEPQKEAELLASQLDGWEYVIPDYKFNSINKRLEDMLKPLSGDDDSGE